MSNTFRIMSVRALTALAIVLMFAASFLIAMPAEAASPGSGSIWTTTGSCGEPQNVNHYDVGELVFINGDNFDPALYDWDITGQPGSNDPNQAVALGEAEIFGNDTFDWNVDGGTDGPTASTSGSGSPAFCFPAYEIQQGDGGVYKVNFGGKNDNYLVFDVGAGSPTPSPAPIVCESGPLLHLPLAYDPVETVQGLRKNGTPVAAIRSNPAAALTGPFMGQDESEFFSLGFGGVLVLEYAEPVTGDLTIWETTWSGYPMEEVTIEVSANGTDWTYVGNAGNDNGGTPPVFPTTIDITGFGPVQYVRVTDITDPTPHGQEADAFDVDVVTIQCPVAATPTPTPNATLTVIKSVINDNGGTAVPGDFTLHVLDDTDTDVANSPFPGDEAGTIFNLPDGNYTVSEDALYGYSLVSVLGDCNADGTITLAPNDNVVCALVNDDIPAEIHGSKFEDVDGNGMWDGGEPGLEGWVINLWDSGMMFLASTSTDMDGHYMFTDLDAGTYYVTETQQMGWQQTTADHGAIVANVGDVIEDIDFGNFELSTAGGTKWSDENMDGVMDPGENGIAGWTFYIDENLNGMYDMGEPTAVSDMNGMYVFEDLFLGTYRICEVMQSGWQQIFPVGDGCYDVDVTMSGQDIEGLVFGNHQDGEGTIGFWKNWTKHKWLNAGMINSWLSIIDSESDWLMTETGFSANTSGMVALINAATKQCQKAGQLVCAQRKFYAQYMTTWLDYMSDDKYLDTWYAVSPDAQALLGRGPMEHLGDIFDATEALAPSKGSMSVQDFLTLAGLFDSINNTGN